MNPDKLSSSCAICLLTMGDAAEVAAAQPNSTRL